MIGALLEALVDAVVRAAGWVAGAVRSVFVGQAVDAALEAGEKKTSRRKCGRGAKAQLSELADPADTEQLRVYHQLPRNDNNRELRIEAIIQIAENDTATAEPLLREIIEGPDDPWVVTAALDTAARQRMTGLIDVVAATRDDPRQRSRSSLRRFTESSRRRDGEPAPDGRVSRSGYAGSSMACSRATSWMPSWGDQGDCPRRRKLGG
jgi:hypothetical protein